MNFNANADEVLKADQNLYMSYQLIYQPDKILIGHAAEPGQALSDVMMPYHAIRCHNTW
jgi:hypothetical protein